MLTDSDAVILGDPWKYFQSNCRGKKLWFNTLEGNCGNLEYNSISAMRERIFNCTDSITVQKMAADRMSLLFLPFAGNSVDFLKILWQANKDRKLARETTFMEESGIQVCTEVKI